MYWETTQDYICYPYPIIQSQAQFLDWETTQDYVWDVF